jgi:hypothetical protein
MPQRLKPLKTKNPHPKLRAYRNPRIPRKKKRRKRKKLRRAGYEEGIS